MPFSLRTLRSFYLANLIFDEPPLKSQVLAGLDFQLLYCHVEFLFYLALLQIEHLVEIPNLLQQLREFCPIIGYFLELFLFVLGQVVYRLLQYLVRLLF